MRTHKHGGAEFKLIEFIVALLVLGLLMVVLMNTNKACQPLANDETCRDSLKIMNYVASGAGSLLTEGITLTLAPDRTAEAIGQRAKSFPLACKYEKVMIKGKTKKEVIPKIRKLVERCWYKMGEGQFSPFGTNTVIPDVHCFTCFVFQAPDLKEGISEEMLRKDLQSTLAPNGQTYWEYIHSEEDIVAGAFENLPITVPIEPQTYYSVILADFEAPLLGQIMGGLIDEDQKTRAGLTKLYITETSKAEGCYNDAWFIGDSRPIGGAGEER